MTAPYSYSSPDGDCIDILPAKDGGARLIAYDPYDGNSIVVRVLPDALPEMVAALYRAAGRTVPVLLNPDEVADDWVRHRGRGAA